MMEDKVERVFLNVARNPTFGNRFFKKLSETDNPYPWFEELRKRKYLDPANNKNPEDKTENSYSVPYWQALGYLENVAKHIAKKPNEEILTKLLDTVNSIIEYKNEKTGCRIENPYTDWMIIKIVFNLPVKYIEEKHIKFIETALLSKRGNSTLISGEITQTILPHLVQSKNKNLLLKLIEIIIKPQKNKENMLFHKTSLIEEYWLSEAIGKYTKEIIAVCGLEVADVVLGQIEAILEEDENQFSFAVINTIEDSSQNSLEDSYPYQLIYLIRNTFEQTSPDLQKGIVTRLIHSKYAIFNRIGIHVINFHYAAFAHLFWSWESNPLEELELTHEVYRLLESNFESFSGADFDRLIDWIENISLKTSKTPLDAEEAKKREAHRRRTWLTAVINSGNPKIKRLYEEYTRIDPVQIEHPGYLFWSSPVVVESIDDSKPFSGEIINRPNDEIAEYLRSIDSSEDDETLEWYGGLAGRFRKTVLDNCQKFSQNLTPFLTVPLKYQYGLLSGILEASRKGKDFSWKELLDFMFSLVSEHLFWEKGPESQNSYKKNITREIGELVLSATSNDKYVLNAEQMQVCENILLLIGKKSKSEIREDDSNIIQSVLNSTLGAVYSAIVTYSYRYASMFKIDVEQKWTDTVKKHFEERLSIDRTVEFDVSLGKFLPSIAYLDKNWLIGNINRIIPKENKNSWVNVFSSYLFYTRNLSKPIYLLLKENNHYQQALGTDFKEPSAVAKLSQIASIAYLNDLETLTDDSLMMKLIHNENVGYLSEIVVFLWRLRKETDEEKLKKIKPLWRSIMTFLASQQGISKYDDVRAKLSWWLSLVDEIDSEIFDWTMTSINYVRERDELFLPEYLLNHVSKTPEFVGKILYGLAKDQKYLTHRNEQTVEIVNKLYELGQNETATRICHLYLEGGYDFLRETCEKHNPHKDQAIDSH